MKETKLIKVSKKNYNMLLREAAKIQYESGKRATFDDAIAKLEQNKKDDDSADTLMDHFGAWKMDEGEAEGLQDAIQELRHSNTNRDEKLWK